jgi:recombination protein U
MNKQSLANYNPKSSSVVNNKPKTRKNISNTGEGFEALILYANSIYDINGIAFIQKLEQPVRITKKYPNGTVTGQLKKSTVDFLGCITEGGRMVAFDAKSTSSKTSFPLSNLEQHQYDILNSYHKKNAFAFLLVEWTVYDEVYVVPFPFLSTYWEKAYFGVGRKSIPYEDFSQCHKIDKGKIGYPLHYLSPFGVS